MTRIARGRFGFASVALMFSLFAAPHARAEDQVDLRFQEGLRFADAGKFEEARQAFVQAYALHPTQPTLWNLAIAEMKMGRAAEALRHLRAYKRRSPQDPEYAKLLPDLVAKLEGQTGQLRVIATRGAEILVDGESVPERAPLEDTIAVMPGAHVIEARSGATASGSGSSLRREVIVKVGETASIDLGSSGGPPTTPPTKPEATEEPASSSLVAPIVLGVAGLVGIGVGVGFGVASQSKKSDADALSRVGVCASTTSPDCQAFNDARESGSRSGTVSVAAYVSGGVLLGGAIAWALVSRAGDAEANAKRQSTTGTRWAPVVDGSRVGIWAEHSF